MADPAIRSTYASFLKGPAGVDFLKQCEVLEKSLVLQAINGKTNDEKANSVSKVEGVLLIRDYVLRQSKPIRSK